MVGHILASILYTRIGTSRQINVSWTHFVLMKLGQGWMISIYCWDTVMFMTSKLDTHFVLISFVAWTSVLKSICLIVQYILTDQLLTCGGKKYNVMIPTFNDFTFVCPFIILLNQKICHISSLMSHYNDKL